MLAMANMTTEIQSIGSWIGLDLRRRDSSTHIVSTKTTVYAPT